MILPSLSFTSSKTAFSLSSNSPRYLAPATNDPISSEKTCLFFNASGTSPRTILCARPSTTAVLPTPGSPIKTGLFFVLRDKIRIIYGSHRLVRSPGQVSDPLPAAPDHNRTSPDSHTLPPGCRMLLSGCLEP